MNLYNTREQLNSGTYKQKPYYEFDINERGKNRHIKAVSIDDRVVQRSLCDNVLTTLTEPYLIYDNGSSQKGKGVQFTRDRLVLHLHRYFRQYGTNEGYVLLVDFKSYFASIPHGQLKRTYARVIGDYDLRRLINYLIDTNGGDVGLGIGSQISQNAGIFYPTPLDQYFKTVRGEKYYAAYMDDRYILCRTKEHARECLNDMIIQSKKLGIVINEKKTQIVPIKRGFTFLKIRYVLTSTGKVVQYVNKDTFTREERKLKKFKKKNIPISTVQSCYRSWRGNILKYKNAYHKIKKMDSLFEGLFPNVEYRSKKELAKIQIKKQRNLKP